MKDLFTLAAQPRADIGKGASRRLRRNEGMVPAIVYGAGLSPTMVSISHDKILRILKNEAVFSHILTLELNDKAEKVILKALQRHPYKLRILHMDLQRVREDEQLYITIPLHFVGEEVAPGVKIQGGQVMRHANELEVRCLPADLPEFIEIDVSKLNINETIHVKDLIMPKGVEVVSLLHDTANNPSIISIQAVKVVEEVEVAAAPIETEITSEKKKEEGEEGAEGKGEKAEKGGEKKEEKKK
jgi:large subunit ribosomal protein L25